MEQIIIDVENREEVDIILDVLREAEENGEIDFAFQTRVREGLL